MTAPKTPAPSVEEYAEQIVAAWPPLDETQRAELSRLLTPVAVNLAVMKTPARRAA